MAVPVPSTEERSPTLSSSRRPSPEFGLSTPNRLKFTEGDTIIGSDFRVKADFGQLSAVAGHPEAQGFVIISTDALLGYTRYSFGAATAIPGSGGLFAGNYVSGSDAVDPSIVLAVQGPKQHGAVAEAIDLGGAKLIVTSADSVIGVSQGFRVLFVDGVALSDTDNGIVDGYRQITVTVPTGTTLSQLATWLITSSSVYQNVLWLRAQCTTDPVLDSYLPFATNDVAGSDSIAASEATILGVFDADGNLVMQVDPSQIGFFGATPASQPAAPVTLEDVIAALQALGLVAT